MANLAAKALGVVLPQDEPSWVSYSPFFVSDSQKRATETLPQGEDFTSTANTLRFGTPCRVLGTLRPVVTPEDVIIATSADSAA